MPSHVFSLRHVPGAEGERVEKFSCRPGGAATAKNCPTIQDSAGNRCEPRFHASEGWIRLTGTGVMVFFSDRVFFFFFINLCPSNNRSMPRTLGHREAPACKQRLFIHSDLYEKILRPISLVTQCIKELLAPRDIFVRRISVEGVNCSPWSVPSSFCPVISVRGSL